MLMIFLQFCQTNTILLQHLPNFPESRHAPVYHLSLSLSPAGWIPPGRPISDIINTRHCSVASADPSQTLHWPCHTCDVWYNISGQRCWSMILTNCHFMSLWPTCLCENGINTLDPRTPSSFNEQWTYKYNTTDQWDYFNVFEFKSCWNT